MIKSLNSYLIQHKSVSIPGMGTIYIERTPAQSDFVNKQILPPSYHYRFDKYSDTPDRDFFPFLAVQQGIADYEAIRLYNDWARQFRDGINKDHSQVWPQVGQFSLDESGEIVFEPKSQVNTFFQAIPAERVLRSNAKHTMIVGDKQLTNVEMTEFFSEEFQPQKRKWWLYAAIAALIALLVLGIHYYRNGFSVESTANQQLFHIR